MNLLFESPLPQEESLLKKFEEIHDYIYSHDGLSPQQTLEEFIKILFIKIFDENNKGKQFLISIEEWNKLKSENNSSSFSERINSLFELVKKTYTDIFDSDDRIKLSHHALGFTINKLQGIYFIDSSHDAKGLAFQKFLSQHEKEGHGQFFTPQPIIDFCVEILQPKPDETILDPACGSGGFLISALKHLRQNYSKLELEKTISSHLFGIEINKSVARIAQMKLLLEANVGTNIICTNSLEDLDNLMLFISKKDGFDVILTNPPFGAKISTATILSKFNLGHKWVKNLEDFYITKKIHTNQNTEILFIERCIQLLKKGGRMAIVLPNGNFENPSLEYLRYFIVKNTRILAVINLPQETFIPYGTGVKTSLLFLEKESENKIDNYKIFFGRIQKLGYQGNKNGTPLYLKDKNGQILKDESGRPVLDEDFNKIIEDYRSFQNGILRKKENSFSIDYKDLNGRFDFDFYAPENREMIANFDKGVKARLGDVCDIVASKSKKLKDKNERVVYIELSDINTHSFEIINSTSLLVHELPSRASYEIQEGDIITSVAGNSVGTRNHATALVNKDFSGSICTNGFRVLRNFKIDPYYLLYYLKSDLFLKQMFMYRTGAAIPNVSDQNLENILIYIPDGEKLTEISKKVKKALALRQESLNIIESIDLK